MPCTELKFVLAGDHAVGKSCICRCLTNGQVDLKQPPIYGFEKKKLDLTVDGFPFVLNIWDTSSDVKVRDLTKNMFADADCALLVYDLTRRHTYSNIEYWMNTLYLNSGREDTALAIVGNKLDQEDLRSVSAIEAEKYARVSFGLFKEITAKDREEIRELVKDLIRSSAKYQDLRYHQIKDVEAQQNEDRLENKGCCKNHCTIC